MQLIAHWAGVLQAFVLSASIFKNCTQRTSPTPFISLKMTIFDNSKSKNKYEQDGKALNVHLADSGPHEC